MRHITQKGLDLIKKFEGFSPTVYLCPAGYKTIGYGHVVKDNEDFSTGITETESQQLLRQGVEIAEQAVLRLINVPLTDNQFDALVSFTYNVGAAALQRSTLRSKVNRQEHEEAIPEFLKWIYANGKKLNGLLNRRQAEAFLYSQQ